MLLKGTTKCKYYIKYYVHTHLFKLYLWLSAGLLIVFIEIYLFDASKSTPWKTLLPGPEKETMIRSSRAWGKHHITFIRFRQTSQ